MFALEYQSYRDIFSKKLKKCKSKKDYKRLCKEMLTQLSVIDGVDKNQCQILSSMVGEDTYMQVISLAIKMYLLERQGVDFDIIPFEEEIDGLDL